MEKGITNKKLTFISSKDSSATPNSQFKPKQKQMRLNGKMPKL